MRIKGSSEQIEDRRRRALRLYDECGSYNRVGRTLGCSPGSVRRRDIARRLGARVLFVVKSGFMLTTTVRRTRAPRARTPVIPRRMKRGKISVISGIPVSPGGRRVGRYRHPHPPDSNMFEACAFLRQVLRHLRGPRIVIRDGGKRTAAWKRKSAWRATPACCAPASAIRGDPFFRADYAIHYADFDNLPASCPTRGIFLSSPGG